MGKQMGRPPTMDGKMIELLDVLCMHNHELEDCAELMRVHSSTITKWIKRVHNLTFSEYRNKKMAHTRNKLLKIILKACETGNTAMIIFTAKNLLGWSDQPAKIDEVKQKVEQLVVQYNEIQANVAKAS